jgi:hypothetical protein
MRSTTDVDSCTSTRCTPGDGVHSRTFPNPSNIPSGQLVVWHHVDSITHRVVLNDGELDTGNMSVWGFRAMPLVAPRPLHCTIHPEMVGTLSN